MSSLAENTGNTSLTSYTVETWYVMLHIAIYCCNSILAFGHNETKLSDLVLACLLKLSCYDVTSMIENVPWKQGLFLLILFLSLIWGWLYKTVLVCEQLGATLNHLPAEI